MNNKPIKANFGKRLVAFLIDFVILSLIFMQTLTRFDGFGISPIVLLVIALLCFCLRDTFGGAGIGKRIVGIAVRCRDNPELTPGTFKLFYRNIFTFAWPLEMVSLLWNGIKIGDMSAQADVYATR